MKLPSKRTPKSNRRILTAWGALAATLVGTLIVSACSSASVGGTGSTCPPESTLTYANFGQTFISTNCGGCHSNKDRPTLSTQAEVQANSAAIDSAAAAGPNGENTKMPQGGSVSTADRTKLGEWLACGAP